ncbi:MAG: SAM-dependent methyltransferase [Lentisphaeria bacterium]|jgi:ribosomal protein L11 methylase PrmA|nr:SAM-dependent methyltransferase [Lentisphaeria bacterium]
MTGAPHSGPVDASFRDPSGFLFERDGILLRQVNECYREHYETLLASGLHEELVQAGLLVPHEEVAVANAPPPAWKVIRPERLPFISYPYEWSFGQFQAAALATLDIQRRAFAKGMILKDASAYNIQFHRGKPVLIDSLSFETYRTGEPWQAYRQFCQHFLAPLALMARKDVRCGLLARLFIDGVPLDLASCLLGWRSRFSPRLLMHIHLHARMQKSHEQDGRQQGPRPRHQLSRPAFLGILDSLTAAVGSLRWKPAGTEWGEYYTFTNYSDAAFARKHRLVSEFLAEANPKTVWDLGANEGEFSRLAAAKGRFTVAFDVDPAAVEKNWRRVRHDRETNLLPLVMDLTNPSPMLGWANRERDSLAHRGPADCVMALAIIHHLAISNNVPLARIAEFLASLTENLIIEFVPKEDSQVQILLRTREDIFPLYHEAGFEQEFGRYFSIVRKTLIEESQRTLYLMKRR